MSISKAMKAVLSGPEVKRLKVQGHHWNFKKATREKLDRRSGTGVVKGRISHNVKFVDDDQIDYQITYFGRDSKGAPKKPLVEVKVKQAAWKKVAPKAVGAVVGIFSKNPAAAASVDTVAKEVFKQVHGDWESVGHGLVAIIAAEFGKIVYPAIQSQRVPSRRATAARIKPATSRSHRVPSRRGTAARLNRATNT